MDTFDFVIETENVGKMYDWVCYEIITILDNDNVKEIQINGIKFNIFTDRKVMEFVIHKIQSQKNN